QVAPAPTTANARAAQAGAGPFGFFAPVGRERKVLVLGARILPERPLRAQNTPSAENGHEYKTGRPEAHGALKVSYIPDCGPRSRSIGLTAPETAHRDRKACGRLGLYRECLRLAGRERPWSCSR